MLQIFNYGWWIAFCVVCLHVLFGWTTYSNFFFSWLILLLSFVSLAHFPEEFFTLKKLDTLYLCGNRLTCIPSSITRLSSLKALHLSGNQIKNFPTDIGALRHLDVLDLSKNLITELPDGCHTIQTIEINLNQNQVINLSFSISQNV